MFQTVEAEDANALWLHAASWFEPEGPAIMQHSRAGKTAEVLRVALTLRDVRQRWISSRVPAMNPAFALAEVIWILRGRNDSAFLNYFNPKLPQLAGSTDTYYGAYGYRLRRHFKLDQLDRAYRVLSADKDSRQVVLQIWDSAGDLPEENGAPRAEDIPCNIGSILKIREGRLEWTQIMRSNDLVLGLPHNIVQFSSLQEILAGWLGVAVGSYHHFTDSLHLYEKDAPVKDRITPGFLPKNRDSIALSKETSDRSFAALAVLGDALCVPEAGADKIIALFKNVEVAPEFRAWAAILTADALRRRKAFREIEFIMSECQNSCLTIMFERWLCRQSKVP